MTIKIPFDIGEVDPEWLTAALSESGLLENQRVVSFNAKVVGQGAGFMGNVAMLNLTLAPPSDAPLSLVLKIPTATNNRHIGQTLGVYEREIRFYQELQSNFNIRTPRHVYSAMDSVSDPVKAAKAFKLLNRLPIWVIRTIFPLMNWLGGHSTTRYVLLIENLEGYRIGDQVGGCSTRDAQSALDMMARMHAQFWGGSHLDDFPWLLSIELVRKPGQMLYLQAVERFKHAHADWLTASQIAVLDWLKVHYFDLMARFGTRPETLMHGDFRLDNLCFDDTRQEAILFDWQTPGRGPCGFDLAYFLSASFAEPPSRSSIEALLEYYRERLATYGVNISADALRWQYEAGLVAVIHRVVPAQFQDLLDLGEGRGVDLIDSWLERGFRELEYIDPDRLLQHG